MKFKLEPSTIRGIIWVLTSFGIISLSQDQTDAVAALGMALAGGFGLLPDGGKK